MTSRYDIQIRDDQTHLVLDPAWILGVVEQSLKCEEVQSAEISIAVVDDPTIRRLNRSYLQHDYATDVISFLLDGPESRQGDPAPRGRGKILSGEVIVSAEMAQSRAEEFGWHAEKELCLYLVHGLLHLCGYDDQTAAELSLMRQREQLVLEHWGWHPEYTARDRSRSASPYDSVTEERS